jgi:trehalose 6-phosphate synthase
MNLVAKEFVAAQDPQDPGVLVLSRFAGAARQLSAALLVNPYNPDEIGEAVATALEMSLAERQDRWQAMWRTIEGTSALAWGRSFVDALLGVVRAPPARPRRPGLVEAPGLAPLPARPIAFDRLPS